MPTTVVTETDIAMPDGAVLHAYDTGTPGDGRSVVLWHHGTPNIGTPPAPLFDASERLGLRWIGYDRPGYGGSTAAPGRDIASAARYAAAVADALEIGELAVMGHSGGGPHALACAALLPDRVRAVVPISSMAPFDASGLDYFDGMIESGVTALSTAADGRDARAALDADAYDPEFTPTDEATFEGPWGWFGSVVGPGTANGPGPAIDDDVAYAKPWGFAVDQVQVPALLLHGEDDGIAPIGHARWLAANLPDAELRSYPGDGHIAAITHAEDALDWLVERLR